MSLISENISLNSLSFPQSVRSETKDRFDAILKAALKKKLSKSKEKLLDEADSTTASSRNLLDNEDQTNFAKSADEEERASKKFILNKFLNDSTSIEASNADNNTVNTVVTLVKPPVPKPRKNKLEPVRRTSKSSTGTFNVASPNVLPKNDSEYINNDKYVKEIGDLVLHDSPTVSKIAVLSSEFFEKADDETLSDRKSSSKSNSSRGTFIIEKDENNIDIEKGKKERTKSKRKEFRNQEEGSIEIVQEVDKFKTKPKQRLNDKTPYNNDTENDTNIKIKSNLILSYDYKNITEIIVHKTDKLLLNSYVIHPVIKIHIVDIRSGNYYKKSDKNRPVVFYYENDSNDYILPVMSGYYNLQKKRTFFPMWEETILLNEDFKYLINENVIIFFDLMDFSTTHFGTLKKNKDCDKGWYKIAFAFLKPVGKNNSFNVNKKLRLQLYYPQTTNTKNPEANHCHIWEWWQNKKELKKYPSTLYITIKEVISPKRVIETFRSKTPLQTEEISSSKNENGNTNINEDDVIKDANNLKLKWKRRLKKDRTLPDELLCQLDGFEEGCFVLKFSNNGLYLACSVKIEEDFQIVIYLIKNFEENARFKSHQALIYSVTWSNDDKYLLSASSDNTVAIWNFQKHLFLQILPHPTFVYTCEINMENFIATGCYDKYVRIWHFNKENYKFELSQELEKHKGFVTSLCFSRKLDCLLYSADSCGEIREWKRVKNDWTLNRKLDILDLRETKINQIVLFSNEKKLLVHSRDSCLRIISIANTCVIHWLHGALNTRIQTFCDISPCENYVTSGSENGIVIVWDTKTGKDVKTYEGYSRKSKVSHCVQFHPKINLLAISHYGSKEPILIYCGKEDGEIQNIERDEIEQVENLDAGNEAQNKEKCDFKRILQKMDQLLA